MHDAIGLISESTSVLCMKEPYAGMKVWMLWIFFFFGLPTVMSYVQRRSSQNSTWMWSHMYNFSSEQIVLSGMMCPAIATLEDEEYTSEKEGDPVNSRTPTQTEATHNVQMLPDS